MKRKRNSEFFRNETQQHKMMHNTNIYFYNERRCLLCDIEENNFFFMIEWISPLNNVINQVQLPRLTHPTDGDYDDEWIKYKSASLGSNYKYRWSFCALGSRAKSVQKCNALNEPRAKKSHFTWFLTFSNGPRSEFIYGTVLVYHENNLDVVRISKFENSKPFCNISD
jgi:hypothetical protein